MLPKSLCSMGLVCGSPGLAGEIGIGREVGGVCILSVCLYFTPNLCRDRCRNKCKVSGRSFQYLFFFRRYVYVNLMYMCSHWSKVNLFFFFFFFLTNSKFTKKCGGEVTHKYQSNLASTFWPERGHFF